MLILLYLCFLPLPSHAAEIDPDRMIRPELLGEAIQAMSRHSDRTNPSRLVIVDYGLHSAQKRLFVVDLETGLVNAYRTTHGRGSDKDHDGFLDAFSDVPGSSASPQGAYLMAARCVSMASTRPMPMPVVAPSSSILPPMPNLR